MKKSIKKSVKTETIFLVHNVLNSAKYTALSDADKIKLWKISRALKPIATKFDEDIRDAAEKLKPEVEGGFDAMLQKKQEYDRKIKSKNCNPADLPMGPAEYERFSGVLKEYNKIVDNAMKEFGDKEVEVEFEPLAEDSFCKLMSSNEWNMAQVVVVGELIVE